MEGTRVEELEDNPELGAAVEGQLLLSGLFQMDAVDDDLAGSGMVEPSQQVEQGALAGATRSRNGHKFPRPMSSDTP